MADYVASLDVQLNDEATAGANTAAASLDRLGAAAETVSERVTRAGASFRTVNKSIDENATFAAKSAAAQAKYEQALSAVRAEAARTGMAADELAEKERRLGVVREQAVAVARRQADALREVFGVSNQTAATADTVAAAQSKAAATVQRSSAALDDHARAARAARGQLQSLAIQGSDFATQLASGASPITAFIQQASQIGQVAAASGAGLSGLAGAVKLAVSYLLSAPVAVAGAAAAFVLMGYQAEGAQSRVAALQNSLRATRADYQALSTEVEAAARRTAATSGASLADARAGASTLASAAQFTGGRDELAALLKTANDLAAVMGTGLPAAAATLAAALKSPGAEAAKLADQGMPGFSAALAYNIKLLQDGGNKAAAYALYMETLRKSVGGAQENLSPFRKALEDLGKAFTGPESAIGGFFRGIGDVVVSIATKAVEAVTAIVKAIDWAAKELGKYLPGGSTPAAGSGLAAGQYGPAAPVAITARRDILPGARDDIYRIAEARNFGGSPEVSAVQADFATRIVGIESSGGHQLGPNGRTLTSSAGALGRFQLMPGTAGDMNVNPHDIEGNTTGGLKYIAQLWSKYGGDPALVAMAYNWGPGNVDKFLAGIKQLPSEVVGYAASATGLSTDDIRGRYAGSFARSGGVSPNQAGAVQDTRNNAFATAQGVGGLSFQRDANGAQQNALLAGMDAAKVAGNTAEYNRLAEALAVVRGRATEMLTEQQKIAKAAGDAVIPLSAEAGATRDLATIRQRFVEAARASGTEVDQGALQQAQLSKLIEYATAHDDAVKAIDRDTEAQGRLAGAYDASARSVIEATNRTKAEEEARATSIPGTETYIRRVDELTEAYNRNSAVKAENATRAMAFGQQDQLETIRAEVALIGQSTDVRTKELAVLKERQRLIGQGGPEAVNTASGQRSLAYVRQIADETAALNRQQNAMNELANVGTQAFDRIGSSITQAFANGSLKALDFKGLMKSVFSEIAQYALKIAIVNPALNALFGGNRTTIGDLGGVVGSLFGGSGGGGGGGWIAGAIGGIGALLGGASGSFGALSSSSPTNQALSAMSGQYGPATAAALQVATTATQPGGFSTKNAAEVIGLGYKGASLAFGDTISTVTQTVKDFAFDAATSVGNLIVGATADAAVGLAAGISTAGATAGQTVSLAAADAFATAGASGVGTAVAGTVASAASSIAAALPYIGVAVSVLTQVAQGNYRGAGLVAGGAIVGSYFGPIGTAVGAAVGAIVDMFLPNHPKNPYQASDVVVQGGKLGLGKVVSQLEDPTAASNAVTEYATAINSFLEAAHVEIALDEGRRIGGVGRGIKGYEQLVDSPDKLFNQLLFKLDASVNQDSNYAKAAAPSLVGQHYETPMELQADLMKFATFADRMDATGLRLESTAKGLTNIRIAEVLGVAAQTGESRNDGQAPSRAGDLRMAMSKALPGQTFATEDALNTELSKINNFVNGTIPSLLNPVFASTSNVVEQTNKIIDTYRAAIEQAQKYGLAWEDLETAKYTAINKVLQPLRDQLDRDAVTITNRRRAIGADAGTQRDITGFNFDSQAEQQRAALQKSLTDVYGETVKGTAYFAYQMSNLEETLAAERLDTMRRFDAQVAEQAAQQVERALQQAAAMRQAARAQQDAQFGVDSAFWSIRGRQAAVGGDAGYNELTQFDLRATQERTAYQRQLVDFYGDAFAATQDYANRLSELETVQGYERLAIIKRYNQQAATEQAATMKQAQGNVQNVLRGLADYARGLQTSALSPLSAQAQFDLSQREFRAVAGAARAGDFNSLSKLQSYADTYLNAGRAAYGSTSPYADAFNEVTGALAGVAETPIDTLTASATQAIMQDVATQITDELKRLREEVAALRAETQHQAAAPARAA